MSKVHLTFTQKTAIHEKLKEVCLKGKEGETVSYSPGWDDEKVVAFIGGEVKLSHVRSIRSEMIGPVRKVKRKPDNPLEARVEALEGQMNQLLARLL